MTLRDCREELACLVESITGRPCQSTQPANMVSRQSFVASPVGIDLVDGRTSGGSVAFELPVTFVVSLSDPPEAQHELDDVMSLALADRITTHETDVWDSARPVRFTPPSFLTGEPIMLTSLIVSLRAAI